MTTRDPEATREKILDAAETVFLAKGYGNAAMSEIADEAGVTKSLLHHHFGSKEGLWTEVKARRFRYYADAQLAMIRDGSPGSDLLRTSFEFYFRFLQQNPQLVRIMAWMFLERDADGPRFRPRHHSFVTPRDFDLSPYFDIVKPNLVDSFDYRSFPITALAIVFFWISLVPS